MWREDFSSGSRDSSKLHWSATASVHVSPSKPMSFTTSLSYFFGIHKWYAEVFRDLGTLHNMRWSISSQNAWKHQKVPFPVKCEILELEITGMETPTYLKELKNIQLWTIQIATKMLEQGDGGHSLCGNKSFIFRGIWQMRLQGRPLTEGATSIRCFINARMNSWSSHLSKLVTIAAIF